MPSKALNFQQVPSKTSQDEFFNDKLQVPSKTSQDEFFNDKLLLVTMVIFSVCDTIQATNFRYIFSQTGSLSRAV